MNNLKNMLVYRYTGNNRKVSFIVTLIDTCEPHVTPGKACFSGKANKSYKCLLTC